MSKLQYICKCVCTINSHHTSIFLVQTVLSSLPSFSWPHSSLSCLMMNLFEGHFLYEQRLGCIFLSSFPSVRRVTLPPGKVAQWKQVWLWPTMCLSFLYRSSVSLASLSMFTVCPSEQRSLVDATLCTAEVKSCWLLSFFVDLSMGKETKSKWLDKLLVFCKYLKKCSVCMFSVVMEYFLKWGVEHTE